MIIIDANIIASAGNKSQYPESVNCRNILNHIDGLNSLKIAMCNKLAYEYRAHWSAIGRTWYTKMLRRGRVEMFAIATREIDRRISSIDGIGLAEEREAKKDSHLLILANQCGKILSNETRSKHIYIKYKDTIIEIDSIVWVSPVTDYEACKAICQPV